MSIVELVVKVHVQKSKSINV